MTEVCILGAGPAGSAAAIAACREGASVQILERSKLPRHKVCGEFLSPGIEPVLERLRLWSAFQELRPARIQRMFLRIGWAEKSASLPETAYGLSRYALDHWLWNEALAGGARPATSGEAQVITTGRSAHPPRGGRLFGFKAHFTGPASDAVELYFAGRVYVGVNCVENGLTNVCGLAPEEELKRCGFEIDGLIDRDPALKQRLQPMRRSWDWIFTGPLEFGGRFDSATSQYRAGDALSFVDPFTGSGLLCALLTGALAGKSAARAIPVGDYLRECGELLKQPYRFSSILRRLAETRAAGPLLRFAPARLIFQYTRPHYL